MKKNLSIDEVVAAMDLSPLQDPDWYDRLRERQGDWEEPDVLAISPRLLMQMRRRQRGVVPSLPPIAIRCVEQEEEEAI